MKYIYHHLGLGDHIICNSLVRSLLSPYENYTMFVKKHNLSSVSFMYNDINNLSFLIGDDSFVEKFIKENKIQKKDLIIAGFFKHPMAKSFDESFYLQNNLNFSDRWNKFYVSRNYESEINLFNYLNLKKGEYIFIHDDISRNYIIDDKSIENINNLKIIRPIKGLTDNIFDYCKIISDSYSAHFIDSSFRLMCDSLSLKRTNIFYHLTMKDGIKRNSNNYNNSVSRLNFNII